MPKQKTHSTSSKKFKVTGTGKLMTRGEMSGKLGNQSPKKKRQLGKERPVDSSMRKQVNRLLGRG